MLTPDDEQFLTELYQAMDQREVNSDDPRFVDLADYPGAVGDTDVTGELVRAVTRSAPGSSVYFSGLRGSGKSTQLLRAKAQLEDQGFAVVRLDAEDYLNVLRPLEPPELLFALAGGIDEVAREVGLLPPGAPSWLKRVVDWAKALPGRVDVEPSAAVGFPDVLGSTASLKLSLRTDESFVAAMRLFFAERLGGLVREANDYVAALEREIRSQWEADRRAWLGLVVMFDSLDHAKGRDGDEADFSAIRDAMETLFTTQETLTRLEGCRLVYCLPPYVRIGDGVVRSLASVKVTTREGEPDPTGRSFLREVLARRTPDGGVARLLGEGELDRLIELSGGNFRDLQRLVQEVSIKANQLPAQPREVEAAISTIRSQIRRNLSQAELALLRQVHASKFADIETQADWVRLSPLFDRYLVLAYRNGEDWYDAHPLVAGMLD